MAARPDSEYNRKRNFDVTSEPAEEAQARRRRKGAALRFVVQKHAARRLHYDFRLELDGTLKSWAVPKGPSFDPQDKRLAVHVEDHPLGYASFEGTIPEGEYGAGQVIVWDQGVWQPRDDPQKGYASGKLKFTLVGEKLAGDWTLVRTRGRGGDDRQWLLIKERDDQARPAAEFDVTQAMPASVLSGQEIADGKKKANVAQAARAGSKPDKARRNPASRAAAEKKPKTPASRSPGRSAGATTKVDLPDTFAPQLATLAERPPGGEWVYEIKFDGYRVMARIHKGKVRLFTRNGHDWTAKMPEQARALQALKLGDSWLDGEMVVLDDRGLPDFQALQNAFEVGRSDEIIYYLFDAPFLNGEDLRQRPMEERREALEDALGEAVGETLRFSGTFDVDHQSIVESACAMSLEGVIGKRLGSPYVSRRSGDWIKLKCRRRQEFIIAGFSKPQGSRTGFGSLLLAVNGDKGEGLLYAGRVGTGFDQKTLNDLHGQLRKLEVAKPAFAKPLTSAQSRGVHWVEPKLICEVEFAEWTRDGHIRHASFLAQRSDKPASQILREKPQQIGASGDSATGQSDKQLSKPSGRPRSKGRREIAGVSVSNPDRVIDAQSGWTKGDLAEYYCRVGDWILPELVNRPVSLMRAPEGVGGETFFQKHAERLAIPNIRHLPREINPKHDPLMEINSLKALVGAVQMGTIELHTWGSNSDSIERPDRFVLDLDPDPALPWRSMIEATQLILAVLDEIGLDAWLKTSGGKGIHIVVPLARHADWDTVKGFSRAVAQFIADRLPDRFTAVMGPKNRIGKIFIDYLRNQRGASAVATYSVRARPGLAVSVPIARDELPELRSADQWNIENLFERLDVLETDPWAGYSNRQRITRKMWEQLGGDPPDKD